jgi:hypothetical protein
MASGTYIVRYGPHGSLGSRGWAVRILVLSWMGCVYPRALMDGLHPSLAYLALSGLEVRSSALKGRDILRWGVALSLQSYHDGPIMMDTHDRWLAVHTS